jgi:hypothetical protein
MEKITAEMVANMALQHLRGPQPTKDPVYMALDAEVTRRFGITCQSTTFLGIHHGTSFGPASRHMTMKIRSFIQGWEAMKDAAQTMGGKIKVKVPLPVRVTTIGDCIKVTAPAGVILGATFTEPPDPSHPAKAAETHPSPDQPD